MTDRLNTGAVPRMRRGRVLGLAALAVALLVAATLWLRRDEPAQATPGTGQPVPEGRAEAVERGDPNLLTIEPTAQRNIGLRSEAAQARTVVQTLRATGTVQANETRTAELRALASGRVLEVNVRLGDRVRASQPLAVYDNIELGDLIGQYDVARAALDRARAEAEVARRSLERARNLVELGALAQAEAERRNAEYQTALSSIRTQEAELTRIEEKLHRFGLTDDDVRRLDRGGEGHREASRSAIRAPFAGVVTQFDIAVGETVGPDRTLLGVTDLSIVWVLVDVYEKDLAVVRRGVPVRLTTDAYPGEVFTGRMAYISDALDPKTRTAKVRIEVPNQHGRLKLDLFVTAELPTPAGREAVMVPEMAVQQAGEQAVVFVPEGEGGFRRRNVRVGAREGGWVEVAGIPPGTRVVTEGSFRLKSLLLREQIGGEE